MNVGIDATAIDPTVRPQDDLYGFVNGGWLATASIPEDRSRYGAFDMLVERSEAAMHDIVEAAAADVVAGTADPNSPAGRVGSLYASFMDVDRVEDLGWGGIADDIEAIASASTSDELLSVIGRLERDGMSGLFGVYVTADAGQPDVEIAYIVQAGIGLPDRDYYLADEHVEIRSAYVEYLGTMFGLASDALGRHGLDFNTETAQAVLRLETRIAEAHWDKVDSRDALKTYNKKSFEELTTLSPDFGWATWATAVGGDPSALSTVVVAQPDTLTAVAALFRSEPLDLWKAWAVSSLLSFAAPYVHDAAGAAHFDFYGRTLSGTPERKARWKRGVGLVESLLGDDGGQLYVERHYPERAAERMNDLLRNVTEAFRQRIEELEWMGPDTRAEALTKLGNFRAKVGKPARWKDYSSYSVEIDDLFGNVKRGNAVETDRQLAKIGQPVDLDEWLMTPQTVNAYYHPLLNEIVFPAAILQPPFFDADAPDAINYGGIGAVIAHEIGHGFDDQGSRFDGSGALRDWWTQDDRVAFDERANALIEQFNHLSTRAAPDYPVNGELTVGENIGDLCGIELSFAAFRLGRGDQPLASYPLGDSEWNDEQLFFLNWAQLWRTLIRAEEAQRLLTIDPHSPADLRANVVTNVGAFHEVFETTPGDRMWREPSERVAVF